MAAKTAGSIYENKQKTKKAMSDAALLHAEKMAKGDIEYSGKALETQKGDWKDEFVLLVLSSPLFLLGYSVFAEDEDISKKLDLYFEKLDQNAKLSKLRADTSIEKTILSAELKNKYQN